MPDTRANIIPVRQVSAECRDCDVGHVWRLLTVRRRLPNEYGPSDEYNWGTAEARRTQRTKDKKCSMISRVAPLRPSRPLRLTTRHDRQKGTTAESVFSNGDLAGFALTPDNLWMQSRI